jgi:hypothetical protein
MACLGWGGGYVADGGEIEEGESIMNQHGAIYTGPDVNFPDKQTTYANIPGPNLQPIHASYAFTKSTPAALTTPTTSEGQLEFNRV